MQERDPDLTLATDLLRRVEVESRQKEHLTYR
jgi:hypothetical protein